MSTPDTSSPSYFSHTLSASQPVSVSFFFTDTPTTEIYTLSLHDALPILSAVRKRRVMALGSWSWLLSCPWSRSEEHTSELQSRPHLVCRLLLEKKKAWSNLRPRLREAYPPVSRRNGPRVSRATVPAMPRC